MAFRCPRPGKVVCGVRVRTMDFVTSMTGDDHKLGNILRCSQPKPGQQITLVSFNTSVQLGLLASAPIAELKSLLIITCGGCCRTPAGPAKRSSRPKPTHDKGAAAPGQSRSTRDSTAKEEFPRKGQHNNREQPALPATGRPNGEVGL